MCRILVSEARQGCSTIPVLGAHVTYGCGEGDATKMRQATMAGYNVHVLLKMHGFAHSNPNYNPDAGHNLMLAYTGTQLVSS